MSNVKRQTGNVLLWVKILIGVIMRLYLCEKPSQGKDISAVLGAKTWGEGCIKGNGVVVTWGIGHLLETSLCLRARPIAGFVSIRGCISHLSVEGMKWDCL
ncbi:MULTISPECIES: hypothetical protein [Pseudomonas syringae group genomosp. 2]|uniref:hypothetical protein n=1 Tax=Pseudomonas syringae group genomosp. 2 TaxID=251698 RepID=UPI0006B9FB04|nr:MULTISPECIES: hypothetical protein [Pseudomonas syringae group genomosp. 2]